MSAKTFRICVFRTGSAEADGTDFAGTLSEAEAIWDAALSTPRFGKVVLSRLVGSEYHHERVAEREGWVVRDLAAPKPKNLDDFFARRYDSMRLGA